MVPFRSLAEWQKSEKKLLFFVTVKTKATGLNIMTYNSNGIFIGIIGIKKVLKNYQW